MLALVIPPFDPVAVSLGPLVIRWYAIAYLLGFVFGWRYCLTLARQFPEGPSEKYFDDFLSWAVMGTVLGGRLGYVFFYQADYYFANPLEIFKVWHGGMSFHGGMLGVIGAAWMYTQRQKISFFAFTDVLACVVPIGLGLGRVANFVNGELYGRVSNVPWALVFPRGGPLPRHPSQLYEALLEGLVLFVVMYLVSQNRKFRVRPGLLSGAFLFCYGAFRLTLELFREPDQQLGFIVGHCTMGQLLCIPMILFGFYLMLRSDRRALPRSEN